MTFYDNGHGMKILHTKENIEIYIYDNSEIYTPFLNLRNIGAIDNDILSSNFDISDIKKPTGVYITPKNRSRSITFIAQNCIKLINKKNIGNVHTLNTHELMIVAYTLPPVVVNNIINYIYTLKSNITKISTPIFVDDIPNKIFGAVLAQYISLRDGLSKGEYITIEGTNDEFVWDGYTFYPVSEKQINI